MLHRPAAATSQVVDFFFARELPAIRSIARTGADDRVIVEVLSQRDAQGVGQRASMRAPPAGAARPVHPRGLQAASLPS